MMLYMRAGLGTNVMVMSVCNAQYSSVVRNFSVVGIVMSSNTWCTISDPQVNNGSQ